MQIFESLVDLNAPDLTYFLIYFLTYAPLSVVFLRVQKEHSSDRVIMQPKLNKELQIFCIMLNYAGF